VGGGDGGGSGLICRKGKIHGRKGRLGERKGYVTSAANRGGGHRSRHVGQGRGKKKKKFVENGKNDASPNLERKKRQVRFGKKKRHRDKQNCSVQSFEKRPRTKKQNRGRRFKKEGETTVGFFCLQGRFTPALGGGGWEKGLRFTCMGKRSKPVNEQNVP